MTAHDDWPWVHDGCFFSSLCFRSWSSSCHQITRRYGPALTRPGDRSIYHPGGTAIFISQKLHSIRPVYDEHGQCDPTADKKGSRTAYAFYRDKARWDDRQSDWERLAILHVPHQWTIIHSLSTRNRIVVNGPRETSLGRSPVM
jgi:hypothetical protein